MVGDHSYVHVVKSVAGVRRKGKLGFPQMCGEAISVV